MNYRSPLTMLLLLLMVSFASAQVRNAPAGNEQIHVEVAPTPMATPMTSSHPHAMDSMTPARHAAFADAVDLTAFRRLAVFDNGRAKIIDTLAREHIERIYGKSRWREPTTGRRYDPVFTWLDLMLHKGYYLDKPVIYVEVLDLRRQMVTLLPVEEQEKWLKLGRLTPMLFAQPAMQEIVDGSAADLRLSKGRNQVLTAWFAFRQGPEMVALVSPPPGNDQWTSLFDHGAPPQVMPAGVSDLAPVSPATSARQHFMELAKAWRDADAGAVNKALRALSDALPGIHPDTYPSPLRRQAEYVYNATHRFTVGYVAYFLATVALLIAFGVHRRWLISLGLTALVAGLLVHTAGFAVRGFLSGRWPIHNQYESFIALSWFAVLVGVILTMVKRQWLFGAAAAALGFTALLIANTTDIPSNEMGQVAGILATSRILYIHVNVIIASYALIALGFFVSLFYLGLYYFRDTNTARFAAAGLGVVTEEGIEVSARRQAMLIDLDRAQMVVLQLAFWLLGTGILLGAYWADHAWGRWWAWDPKETWALITWIIYLIVIHVRFAVRRPHLVTAWLSVLGFFVMIWTHWGVNLLLAGLHSYA